MNTVELENNVNLETLISIFTIDNGEIKVLLERVKEDPYKGYWILPNTNLHKGMTIEDNLNEYIENDLGFFDVSLEQNHVFSDISEDEEKRRILISFNGIIDNKTIELKRVIKKDKELQWFLINEIPKMGFDHEKIIINSIDSLKSKITNTDMLKLLFPSDFTLPELQKVFELILNKKLDRRNFRKKFISLDLIEDTNEFNIGCNGRPAKLYRFKDDVKQINLF